MSMEFMRRRIITMLKTAGKETIEFVYWFLLRRMDGDLKD